MPPIPPSPTRVTPPLIALALSILLGVGAWAPAHATNWTDRSSHLPQAALADRSMDAVLGDANGDGHLDLFIAKEFAPNLLLLNDGSGRFSVAQDALPALSEDSEDAIVGDYDRDGDIDVVFVSEDTTLTEYYRNGGQARFTVSPCPLPNNLESNGGAAGDIDRDGDLDLIIASNRLPERVLLNNGAGCFTDASSTWMPANIDVTQDVQLADLDGDNDLDLVVGNEPAGGARNRIYIHQGSHYTDESASRLPVSAVREETRKIAVADLDGDGDRDIVFANVDFQSPSVAANRVLINDGRGFFQDESASRLPGGPHRATLDVIAVDIDGDGDRDLVLGNSATGLQVLANDGAGRFSEATAPLLGGLAVPRNVIGVLVWEEDGRRWLYEAAFNAADRLLSLDLGSIGLRAGHSGVFYNPEQSGHGVFINITADLVTLAWFTYDADGRNLFLTASGPRPAAGSASATLNAFYSEGMRFRERDPATLRTLPWGTLRWTAEDCDSAVLEYASDRPASDGLPYGSGRIPMRRLVGIDGLGCP